MDEVRQQLLERVPERISGLVDLAFNLWWSWHPQARNLFRLLNPQGWRVTNGNPVMMLRITPNYFLEKASKDPDYLHYYDVSMYRWKLYMGRRSRWFTEQYPDQKLLNIAYFSLEYGLHHSLPFYSGGLGILAGDHLKECSDLGVPLIGVGFMYGQGYLAQHISPDGWQENICEPIERENAPVSRVMDNEGKQLLIQVPYFEPPIYVAIWKVDVGQVPLYLMDTNIKENEPHNRPISSRLYTGDKEMRLRQEIVLGIGGRKMLETLGVNYYAMHLNEGHSAFVLLERIRDRVERGFSFEQALEQVQG
ncbi:MAG TPA: alpha-glucan family phosphorylase, partial [Methanomicrobiales archaeon]|nr:alpha-glucan family phosphorylase [Methanomicrobiales archaeon]